MRDINNDGKKEIIFSAWAPHNKVSYNNMNDDTSYVGALDCQGNLLWQYKAGGYYSKEYLAIDDLDINGKIEVITARSCHRDTNPDPAQIQIYDALTGEIIKTANYPGISFTNLFVTNMDNDPNLEIISCDTVGGLRIWNHDLEIYKEFKGDTEIRILGVEKVQENSFPSIFTWYSYKNLRIFDNQLRTIFNYRFQKELTQFKAEPIVPVSDGKNIHFVLTTDRTYMISQKPEITFQDLIPLIRSHFSLYMLGVFVFNGFLYVIWRQRKRIKERYLELIGKGTRANPQWTVTAQEALHKMKSPITAILWETEKIDGLLEKKRPSKTSWSKLREINTDILADVNELKLMNHFLMKYLQVQTLHLREINIKDIITCLADKYQSSFGNKFTFSCKFSSPLAISRYVKQKENKTMDSIYMIAEINHQKFKSSLLESDVNEVICSSDITENLMIQSMFNHGIASLINSVIFFNEGNEFYVIDIKDHPGLVGKTFDELMVVLRSFNIQLIGIKICFYDPNEQLIIDRKEIERRLKGKGLTKECIINPVENEEVCYNVSISDQLLVFALDEKKIKCIDKLTGDN